MNSFAKLYGYTGKELTQKEKEEAIQKQKETLVNLMFEQVLSDVTKAYDIPADEVREVLTKFIGKYSKKLLDGEYKLISEKTLLLLEDGQVVDSDRHVIVWKRAVYNDWDLLPEL